jgi:tRNA(Ile)-lysidine synthase
VVVAVSGGTDSTALLLLLAELADELGIVLHVAHFDHRTRPRQSAKDADAVTRLANRVGAPIRIGRASGPTTSEDDARRARYEFLRRAAREIGATAVATGHTRDDQAETVLLHLARGSGLAGLAGMRPLRDGIARPLLCIGRAETAAVCKAARIRPLADPTNRSLRFARNRVRLRVLPELAKLNPRVREAIARLAEAAAELEDRAGETVAKALADAGREGAIDLDAIGRTERDAVLASAWHAATGRVLSARHRAALAALADSRDGTRALDLPGGRAVREYARLHIVFAGADASTADGPAVLRPGGELSWNGWRLHLGGEPAAGAHVARVPDDLSGTLGVRARRPGDRDPAGRKLQDLFTDAKVPLRLRGRWPVVTSDDGVWWVPGIGPARENAPGMALAVYPPSAGGNARLSGSVRQVASKDKASRSSGRQRGRPG